MTIGSCRSAGASGNRDLFANCQRLPGPRWVGISCMNHSGREYITAGTTETFFDDSS